ncbi:MAG TPA: hypothetical protein ENI23_04205 [bacterium]|nr:hypothetical protein [bacterium]
MTSEICECEHEEKRHIEDMGCNQCQCKKFKPQKADLPYKNNTGKTKLTKLKSIKRYYEKNKKPQNHSHPENTSDLVEASKCSGDTEPEEASPRKASGSGSLSDKIIELKGVQNVIYEGVLFRLDVKEAVKKLKKRIDKVIPKSNYCYSNPNVKKEIDKIFGEALV